LSTGSFLAGFFLLFFSFLLLLLLLLPLLQKTTKPPPFGKGLVVLHSAREAGDDEQSLFRGDCSITGNRGNDAIGAGLRSWAQNPKPLSSRDNSDEGNQEAVRKLNAN